MQRGLPRPSMTNEGNVANTVRWGMHGYLLPRVRAPYIRESAR
jgi:hypothetical protein